MSKENIRERTGIFLDSIQRSNTFGALNQDQFYTDIKNTLTEPGWLDNSTIVYQDDSNKSLTGAAPAILPLQIATARMVKNGDGGETLERISFTMLISPDSWNHGKTQSSQSSYTRNGWVPQLWGPNQDTISSSGKTAAFMTPSTGMDYVNGQLSFGYLNFVALISAYRNNGYVFQDFLSVNDLTRAIKTVHGIQILYDNQILCGHFNSFTIDELEETPFVQNYNFEFIVSTLTGSEYETRGHYRPIPLNEKNLDAGTSNDPGRIVFADDPFTKGANNQLVAPRPVNDQTTIRLWTLKTGLPWSAAFSFTDGSVQGNLALRAKLMNNQWDPTTKSFK